MARRRRDNTTADKVQPGDRIIAPNGYEATVDRRWKSKNCTEDHVVLRWKHDPDDFKVNANFRGQSSGRIFRPGDRVTRWIKQRPVLPP